MSSSCKSRRPQDCRALSPVSNGPRPCPRAVTLTSLAHVLIPTFAALALVLLSNVAGLAARGAQLPNVLIWVDARNPAGHSVSVTYPKLVPRGDAERDLGRLLLETGWTATSASISDGGGAQAGEVPMTSVELTTPQAADLQSGGFHIEPIAKAFKNLKQITILYLAPPDFKCRGLGNYENKYVKITLKRGTNTYEYTVNVKDSGFDRLGLPRPELQRHPAVGAGRADDRSNLAIIVLVIALALATAALAYVITDRLTRGSQQRLR